MDEVYETGYGVVSPTNDDIVVEEPEMFKQGGQYGIKKSRRARRACTLSRSM
ncbi:MAG: hypothetical protein L6V85_08840 [Clostridiales bacterium]|nr:MAG: hypothetical protein L6V85_08840 [Clostridiales bacterium]